MYKAINVIAHFGECPNRFIKVIKRCDVSEAKEVLVTHALFH